MYLKNIQLPQPEENVANYEESFTKLNSIITSPSRMVRLTPLRISCFDSEITAERSLTSSRSFPEPPASVEEETVDSTVTAAAMILRDFEFRIKRHRWEVESLKGKRTEVEEQEGAKRAIETRERKNNPGSFFQFSWSESNSSNPRDFFVILNQLFLSFFGNPAIMGRHLFVWATIIGLSSITKPMLS